MTQIIKLKRSNVVGNVPTAAQLELGEIAINTADGKVFIKKSDNSVIEVGSVDGNGIFTASGTIPSGVIASVTDTLQIGTETDFNQPLFVVDQNNESIGIGGGTSPVSRLRLTSIFVNTDANYYTGFIQGAKLAGSTGNIFGLIVEGENRGTGQTYGARIKGTARNTAQVVGLLVIADSTESTGSVIGQRIQSSRNGATGDEVVGLEIDVTNGSSQVALRILSGLAELNDGLKVLGTTTTPQAGSVLTAIDANGNIDYTTPSTGFENLRTISVDANTNPVIADNIDIVFYSDSSLLGGSITLPLASAGKQIKLIATDNNILAKDTTINGQSGEQVNGSGGVITRKILYNATTFISDGVAWYGSSGQSITI